MLWFVSLIGITSRGAEAFRIGFVRMISKGLSLGVSLTDGRIDEGAASVRPVFLSLIAGLWVVIAIMTASGIDNFVPEPVGRALTAAALAAVVAFLLWFARARTALERRFPASAPRRLLTLRVFGSPHLADFLELTSEFKWIGTRLQLDGPGTSGQKTRDVLNFVAGRLDRSIVENTGELEQAIATFVERPDRQLRYPVNSMQCNNAIWKEAVDRMIERSDAVVMDLASLSTRNMGVAYEVGRLLARVETSRIVLLIDATTDRQVLRRIVADAWAAMPADSPNAGNARTVPARV